MAKLVSGKIEYHAGRHLSGVDGETACVVSLSKDRNAKAGGDRQGPHAARRYAAGLIPNSFLNTRANAASDP